MSEPGEADALLAAALCAADPRGLGGMILRGGGEARDRVVAALCGGLPAGAPVRRVPPHADHAALLGGLDMAATLGSGAPVRTRGLLAEADGGVLLVPMAERMGEAMAARIAGALDAGTPAQFVVVLLDDGLDPDERPPAVLADRLAFHLDLATDPPGLTRAPTPLVTPDLIRGPAALADAGKNSGTPGRARGDEVGSTLPDRTLAAERGDPLGMDEEVNPEEVLVQLSEALGIGSARADLFALRAARAAAVLAGRTAIGERDLMLAARLVLGPRATCMPDMAEPVPESAPPTGEGEQDQGEPEALEDRVLAATLASLPADLLARLGDARRRGPAPRSSGAGDRRRSTRRGRPLGARVGVPRDGLRLSLIDTLRAAAPWQRLRGRQDGRVRIRRDDLHIRRYQARAEAVTIFAVDASGSAALARLAEAKGAVELLLAQAYVKRAQVALVAFRGSAAELLLPPTRSLARARRLLAELPGGGGTPLASGLAAARELAEAARARGRTPFVVVLTDGRANVAADGSTVRERAEADAQSAARAIRLAGIGAAFVDTSPRPRAEGARLAAAMGARYLPLPRADAAAMYAAVSAARPS